jgi:hypothetical protein
VWLDQWLLVHVQVLPRAGLSQQSRSNLTFSFAINPSVRAVPRRPRAPPTARGFVPLRSCAFVSGCLTCLALVASWFAFPDCLRSSQNKRTSENPLCVCRVILLIDKHTHWVVLRGVKHVSPKALHTTTTIVWKPANWCGNFLFPRYIVNEGQEAMSKHNPPSSVGRAPGF